MTTAERAILNAHRRMLTNLNNALAAHKAAPSLATTAALLWANRCRGLVAAKRLAMARR